MCHSHCIQYCCIPANIMMKPVSFFVIIFQLKFIVLIFLVIVILLVNYRGIFQLQFQLVFFSLQLSLTKIATSFYKTVCSSAKKVCKLDNTTSSFDKQFVFVSHVGRLLLIVHPFRPANRGLYYLFTLRNVRCSNLKFGA